MQLNDAGRMAQASWEELPTRFSNICPDALIVMPNHVHGIIMVGAQFIAPNYPSPNPVRGRDKSRPYIRQNGACV
jgi:hypothetical protein